MTFSNLDTQKDKSNTIISSSFFIMKDDDSLLYLMSIIDSFENKNDFSLIKHHNEPLAYKLLIKSSGVFFPEITNGEESISIWQKIQEKLAEECWFFVDEVIINENSIDSTVEFYHQDGRKIISSAFESKKNILNKFGI